MIKILDSFIADKIAAGEVIERPVSIVKELVENSIDARAQSVIIEIRNGGKSYIRVTDDGIGIPADEVELAFERHATSKISTIDDLNRISSLGFRGEALSSIAAVSRLTVYTRTSDADSGIRLVLHSGRKVMSETVGTNVGTTIIIEDVFYNLPARRKFMGSDAREASAIIELIEHYAICYAGIRFMLVNNGETIFTTNGDGDCLNAVKTVYPTRDYAHLIPVKSENISGYISDPGTTKTTRRGQLFFVNGRLVNSKDIEKGIEKGYGSRVFSGYPIAILFINIDPSDIDVNIHPGKKEIKFLHPDDVITEISELISEAMYTPESVPSAVHGNKLKENEQITYEGISGSLNNEAISIDNHYIEKAPELEPEFDIRDYLTTLDSKIDEIGDKIEPPMNPEADSAVIKEKFTFDNLNYAGYFFNTYIIMQREEYLYIFDQHAAHERIFYDKFIKAYKNTEQIPQPILTPIVLYVSPEVYSAERDWMSKLAQIGYDINDFGSNTFIIRGIPSFMSVSEAENFASSFIDNLDEYSDNLVVIDKLIMKSCKSAVKAKEVLSEIEIKELLRHLAECDNPFSCPHGRPTFIKISKGEVERAFKRK